MNVHSSIIHNSEKQKKNPNIHHLVVGQQNVVLAKHGTLLAIKRNELQMLLSLRRGYIPSTTASLASMKCAWDTYRSLPLGNYSAFHLNNNCLSCFVHHKQETEMGIL